MVKEREIRMKATGIVRQIDSLGRIVIPKELRRVMKITDEKDSMEIFTEGDTIILKKYEPCCMFCNEADDLVEFKGHSICKSCLNELNKAAE